MFRGKESSNRIELSWLVQDLLNFGVLGSLRLWGGGRWVGGHLGAWGVSPHTRTCTCMHAHVHTHIYTCIEIANGRQHGGIHVYHVYNMFNMHVHVCMHACAYVCMRACMGHPPTYPYPSPPLSTHPPSPRGVDPRNHLKFNNTSTYQDISILFEDLKSVKNSPPMSGCVVWWVGWWVGSGQITKNLKIVDWIKIIQSCLKIYDL